MSEVWRTPGVHGLRFHPDVPSAHAAIAQFFTAGADASDPLLLMARRATFSGVAMLVGSGRFGPPIPSTRIHFSDVDAALSAIMDGNAVDEARGATFFSSLLANIRSREPSGTIRFYGEGVDVLCERGNFAAALALESLVPGLFATEPRLTVLCGYMRANLLGDGKEHIPAIRVQHTHVDGGDAAADNPDEGGPPRAEAAQNPSERWVYVIDDDASMRRSLGRLLRLSGLQVRTFDSGEAFLLELDGLAQGSVVIDIQLTAMSGLDVLAHLTRTRPQWPLFAMSGSDDANVESETLRLGARVFLKKPFDPQVLLAAVETALA